MKKITISILLILIMFPFFVKAITCEDIDSETINNYLKNPTYDRTYKLYLNPTSGELLSEEEYNLTKVDKNNDGSSYLFDGYNYCAVTKNGVVSIPNNNNSNVKMKIVETVKSDTKVSGSGSYVNPWVFSSNYLITLTSNSFGKISLNDGASSNDITFYTMEDGINVIHLHPNSKYTYIGNSCGLKLNADNKSLTIKNIDGNKKCEIFFGREIYKVSLKDTTNTYEYISEVNPKDLYVSPKIGWYSDTNGTSPISKITPPQIKGYLFKGYTNGSGEEFINSNGEIISGKTEVFDGESTAKIKTSPITYKIVYNGNGATGGSTATSTHTYNTIKTLTTNGYTRTGYVFTGWNTQPNGSGTIYTNAQNVSNLTTVDGTIINLYAQWKDTTAPTCTITKTSTGGENGVNVSVTCSDNGSGCKTSTINESNLKGSKTYTVYDNAGNSASCTLSVSSYSCNPYSYECGSYACGSYQCGSYACGSYACGSYQCGSYACGSSCRTMSVCYGSWDYSCIHQVCSTNYCPSYCTSYCTSYCPSYCTSYCPSYCTGYKTCYN